MTKEELRMGQEITGSIKSLADVASNFDRKISDLTNNMGMGYSEAYSEVIALAIHAATNAFKGVILPKIEELEKQLSDI